MMSKYTVKTKEWLRENGFLEWTVERYVSAIHKRIDLYHCIDVLGINPRTAQTVGVQSTGPDGLKEHLEALTNSGLALAWVKAGNKLWLIAWKLRPRAKGSKAKKWLPDLVEIDEKMFTELAWEEYETL